MAGIYRYCAECGSPDGGWTGLCWKCKREYEETEDGEGCFWYDTMVAALEQHG
jgi:hypothetical protein